MSRKFDSFQANMMDWPNLTSCQRSVMEKSSNFFIAYFTFRTTGVFSRMLWAVCRQF